MNTGILLILQPVHEILVETVRIHFLKADDIGLRGGQLLENQVSAVLPIERPRSSVAVLVRSRVFVAENVVAYDLERIDLPFGLG